MLIIYIRVSYGLSIRIFVIIYTYYYHFEKQFTIITLPFGRDKIFPEKKKKYLETNIVILTRSSELKGYLKYHKCINDQYTLLLTKGFKRIAHYFSNMVAQHFFHWIPLIFSNVLQLRIIRSVISRKSGNRSIFTEKN